MPIKGIIHLGTLPLEFNGSDFDFLRTLSFGGVKVAALLLYDHLEDLLLECNGELNWLTVPVVVSLKGNASVAVRSLVEDLYLEAWEVLCITPAPASPEVQLACGVARLPLLAFPPQGEAWPPNFLTIPGSQRREEPLDCPLGGPSDGLLPPLPPGSRGAPLRMPAWTGLVGGAVRGLPLEELSGSSLDFLARLIPQASRLDPLREGGGRLLVVGLLIKPSRYLQLLREGLVPLGSPHGVSFQLLSPEHPLHAQGHFDALLAKCTDFLEEGEEGGPPRFSPYALAVVGEAERELRIPVIDPLSAVQKVVDRKVLADCLAAVSAAAARRGLTILSPASLLVDNLGSSDLEGRLSRAGVTWPLIAKPLVGCGHPDAHKLALLFSLKGLSSADVPLPSLLQRFVDHAGLVHKVYVIGDQVHVVQKESLPDLGAWVAGVGRHSRPEGDAGCCCTFRQPEGQAHRPARPPTEHAACQQRQGFGDESA
eukprot:jgi/Botrbrau1/15743/Bobra.4_1s0111.1